MVNRRLQELHTDKVRGYVAYVVNVPVKFVRQLGWKKGELLNVDKSFDNVLRIKKIEKGK